MHDTAFQIGTLAMNIYADLRTASVLEIGSQAVNGSLRENALSTTKYVGMDIEQGDGVDIVVEAGKPLPAEDASFDLVMASSVFEHDPFFWNTFVEMCRVTKDGGYIYINAPSNGVVHRYPQDNWRFYPDSGRALAQWAVLQGQHASLVESFTADRADDIWNDFVAVFRKGRITKALPKVFLHEHVPSSNVITWKSKKVINPKDEPQDMALLREANERANAARESLAEATSQRDSKAEEAAQLAARLAEAEEQGRQQEESLAEAARQRDFKAEEAAQLAARLGEAEEQGRQLLAERQLLQKQLAEAAEVQSQLAIRESELRQRQEEIAQTRAELARERRDRDEARAQLSEVEQRLQLETAERTSLEQKLGRAEAELEKDRGDFERQRLESDRRIGELNLALNLAQDKCRHHDERWAAHFGETATLSKMLLQREQEALRESEKVRRFREIYHALAARPRWWAILPRSHRARMDHRRLQRLGIFDAQSYLRKNPDVAQSGMDPVFHFLNHGIDEDRPA